MLHSRIDTDTGGEPDKEEIDLSKVTSAKVSSLFLDPGGNHLLVSTKHEGGAKPALLYLHRSRHQPRQVASFTELVTAVGWNYGRLGAGQEASTGSVLIGTVSGKIIETELTVEEGILEGLTGGFMGGGNTTITPLFYREQFNIGKDEAGKDERVTGLQVHQLPSRPQFHIILAATPTRLFQFQGQCLKETETVARFTDLFTKYLTNAERNLIMPSSLKYSDLAFFFMPAYRAAGILYPQQFGWLTEKWLQWGKVENPRPGETEDFISVSGQLGTTEDETGRKMSSPPRQVVFSNFGILLDIHNIMRGPTSPCWNSLHLK